MPYTHTNRRGTAYVLHGKRTTLKSGNAQTIYFFAKTEREGALDHVPEGYEVSETKNGLPVLRRTR